MEPELGADTDRLIWGLLRTLLQVGDGQKGFVPQVSNYMQLCSFTNGFEALFPP